MADINNINIDTNNYTIDILEQPSYEILLNGQGPQGARGYTGNGIASINLTSTSGNIDTYTITYTDGQTSTFDVTNGLDGQSTSIVSVSASVDENIGTPSVTVIEGGTVTEKTLDFEFSNLKGQPGDAATISVGSVTTGEPGTSATVVNSGTSSAAVFDFTIPKGAKGDTGDTGATGTPGVSVTGVTLQSTVGLDKTYRMSFSDGTYFDYVVSDGTDGGYTLPIASSSTLGGIKVGNNLTIDQDGVLSAATSGTVDQTYTPTSQNAQSGKAINGAKFIRNTASQSTSLAIKGSAGAGDCVVIGDSASSSYNENLCTVIGSNASSTQWGGTALGFYATVNGQQGISLGSSSTASATKAIQIGGGTNKTANTLQIGFGTSTTNYQLLDGTTGLIPDARISSNIARTSQIPSAVTESTVAGWGFTKNEGTVKSVNGNQPDGSGNVAITIPTANNGMLTITQDGNTLGTFGANQSANTTIDIPTSGSSRNIGEIVSSTLPLTDAGLHLLDGTLLQYGIYQEFIDYIADLYAENPTANYFTDETTWQNSVTQYGSCGKFVYDSVSKTVRLPKVSNILQCTTDINALGNLVKAGLPNIAGHTGQVRGYSTGGSGALYQENVSNHKYGGSGSSSVSELYIDASRSNSIYGNSTTVQPQTIKAFVYIVIANSTKTSIQVDIDEIATDLNNKAGTDLANVTDSAKVMMAGMGMPSNRYIDLTLGASGSTYTAPANGWFSFVSGADGSYPKNVELEKVANNESIISSSAQTTNNTGWLRCCLPVMKGDSVKPWYNNVDLKLFRFVYAKGSESEA